MNRNTSQYWKKRFNEAALSFENDADIGLWGKQGFEQGFNTFFRIFQENYSTDKRKKILDIGCGSGAYTRKLNDMGYTVVGIDYAENAIKKAIEKSKGEDISYIIGALPFLPFKGKNFDIAICMGVFQSIDDPSAAISDIGKILKENSGSLILMTLNSLSIRIIFKKILYTLFRKNKNGEKEISAKRYNPYRLKGMLRNDSFHSYAMNKLYSFPKMLISLKNLFENYGILRLIDKIPIVSLLIANAFIINAVKLKKNYKI